jgi:hypothetical protein
LAWLPAVIRRTSELSWITPSLEDIRSDLSVFHRVDDMESMPALRFVSMAERLVHYDGVIRHGAMLAAQEDAPDQSTFERPADLAEQGDADAMAIHPVWGQLGTFSKAPAL